MYRFEFIVFVCLCGACHVYEEVGFGGLGVFVHKMEGEVQEMVISPN